MEHGEKFLRIVEDAKSRIREISLAEVKGKLDAGIPRLDRGGLSSSDLTGSM
jgi:hypothetical protein